MGEISTRLTLNQSLVSHHLRLLRAARLLKAGRRGKQVFYSIPHCHVREMLTAAILAPITTRAVPAASMPAAPATG